MMVKHVGDKNRQSNCHFFLCLIVSCCAINVFHLDRTKGEKPNLIAINQRQEACKKDCSSGSNLLKGEKQAKQKKAVWLRL